MKNGYALYQCRGCSAVFTWEHDESHQIKALYDHYYDHAHFTTPPVVVASLEKLIHSFSQFRRTGRWLDVGYGEGGLLDAAEKQGWKCYGTEVSPGALQHGERRGWVASSDGETDPRFPPGGFDVVTMIELLEHVSTPDRFLRAAANWLRPGGVLYITTPNVQSLNWRLLGTKWSVVSPPEHLTLWTARGLGCALANAGFRTQQVRTEGFNPSELLAQLRPRRRTTPQPSRNESGLALNEALSRSPLRRWVKAGINRWLSFFRIGDSLKVQAIRP
jgi:SAM-dependent methyltransferase